jgi:hypothetical protein
MKNTLLSLWVPIAFVLATGCFAEVDREIDCANICERYQDCLPGDQDESECRDRCDNSSTGEVDACDACLDESSCFDCGFECAGPLGG